MKAFVVLDEGYINQAVVSLSSFFKYNRIELIIYAEKGTDLCRRTGRRVHGILFSDGYE